METCSHLLEIRMVMDKCLVCDIQVQDINLATTGYNIQTNKWLRLESWLEIDEAIKRLIGPFKELETLDDFESNEFHIAGAIRVDCKKMKVSRSQKRILGEDKKYLPFGLDIKVTQVDIVALIEKITLFEQNLSHLNINGKASRSKEHERPKKKEKEKILVHKENHREYDPTAHITVTEKNSSDYVPYTASVKTPSKLYTSGSAISEPYSPKPISIEESTPDQISESPNEIPNYKPARKALDKLKETELAESNNEKPKSMRRKYSPEVKLKSRFGESSSHSNGTKRKTSEKINSSRNADLFGSDDSDQELITPLKVSSSKDLKQQKEVLSTPPNEIDSKKKRLKLRHENSSSRKNPLEGWLSKGSIKSSDKSNGKSPSKSKSSRHESSKSDVSRENRQKEKEQEIEEQKMRDLAALQDLLKAKRKSPPPKIEILSLTHLSLEEILGTFDEMRPILDQIFNSCSKKTKITGYNGINHMKTLMLIDDKNQLHMLSFLRENYQPQEKGVPSLTDLYINAMVPEWTVNVFMKEFNFTRKEALERLEAQEDSTVHYSSADILNMSDPI